MTIEEFMEIKWHYGMIVRYGEIDHFVNRINMQEKLIGIKFNDSDDEFWVRCENIYIPNGSRF